MFKGGFLAGVYSENPVRLDSTGGAVTRFLPEPNGFLHLGHTKAIMINFGFARFHGGDRYLRFDDTNPTGEEEKYFVAIEGMINWLRFKAVKVTHSSDNFDRPYELEEELINRDGAYVCHCTSTAARAMTGMPALTETDLTPNPWPSSELCAVENTSHARRSSA